MDCCPFLLSSTSLRLAAPFVPLPTHLPRVRTGKLPGISFLRRRRCRQGFRESHREGFITFGAVEGENEVTVVVDPEEKGGEGVEEEEEEKDWVHFVGIGGSGLSALAMLALKQGFAVSGSDVEWSSFMDRLLIAGAILHIGHSTTNMQMNNDSRLPDALVISSAIPADNIEIMHAVSLGIPVYKREVWMQKVTKKYNLVAISGTHGKSTTAAMLSYVLHAMGDNLISVVGANVPQFSGGNVIPGEGPNFVIEADEYDGCFLGLSPYIAVITNVEWEHVDIFQNEEAVINIFSRFVKQIMTGGHLILCGESAGARALMPTSQVSGCGYHIITYGLSPENDWFATSIRPNSLGGQDYMLCYRNSQIARISLQLSGVYNVLNSLAVIVTVVTLLNNKSSLYETINSAKRHLRVFKGVSRRFELIGKVNGCLIFDDYAHHPTEVRAVLQAARQKFPELTIWVVFQPHTFSRLAAFMNDFCTAFINADYVIVTEIYAARENDVRQSFAKDLADTILNPPTHYVPKLENVIEELAIKISSNGVEETVVLTLGAGDITTVGPRLLQRLQMRAKAFS